MKVIYPNQQMEQEGKAALEKGFKSAVRRHIICILNTRHLDTVFTSEELDEP